MMEKEEDLTLIFKVRKTILKMLEDRGYQIDQKMLNQKFEDFKLSYSGKENLCILAKHSKKDNDFIYVEYGENTKLGVGDITSFAERLHEKEIKTGILIIKNSITPLAKQKIHEFDKYLHIEYFEEKELIVNITEHELVPKHVTLNDEEKKVLLQRYRLNDNQLPKILISDPVARYLGLRRGQVVKIIRPSETAGRYDSFGPCQKDKLLSIKNEEPEPVKTYRQVGAEIDCNLNLKKEKLTSRPSNPNKDDILIIPSSLKEKKPNNFSPQLEKMIRIKVFNDIKNMITKLENIIESKRHMLKFSIFNELRTKYFYYSEFRNKQIFLDLAYIDKVLTNLCAKCDSNLKRDSFSNPVNNNFSNNNNNLCTKCNSNMNSNKNESIISRNLSVENLVILNHEKNLLLGKIKSLLKLILKSNSNKQKVFIGIYFCRWSNSNKFAKYYSNLKNEYEKKYASKFEAKIQENNKSIKKLDKEKIEITIKNESLLQSIQVNSLKINTFKDKEKSLNAKLKALTSEKKKVLSDLHKNQADIDNKIFNLENAGRELESKINKLKEVSLEKDLVLNKYVDEMNEVLDYYEKKTNELISQKQSKNHFYQNNDTLNLSSRNKDYRGKLIFDLDRSSSETKLKISSSQAHNHQNFLRPFTNRNTINHKNPRPLYIKNPYLEGFNTINPDFRKTMTGKYSNVMKASFLGINK